MAKTRELTRLELTALGIAWKNSSCTAYQIIKEFKYSSSPYFRSGAGSVYPLMNRLERDGFLQTKESKRGNQDRQVYSVSAKGKKALREWLSPPIQESDFTLASDPIRTRVFFLGLLPPKKQREFLDTTYERLKQVLKQVKAELDAYQESGNIYGEFATLGAIRETKARLDWISELRQLIPPKSDS